MAHARRTIREAAVAALVSASTAAGARVYDHPYNVRKVFPSLTVEDLGANFSDGNVTEAQEQLDLIGDAVRRRYRFAVIAEIQQSASAAAARDDLMEEVEIAIAALSVAGVESIFPVAYQAGDSNVGETSIRRGVQVFEAVYITPRTDPSSIL